jgi:asparagine synthase (glutamine-hydrolysing)
LRRVQGYARVWRWSPVPLRRAAATAVRTFGGSSVSTAKTAALLETDGGLASTYPIMRQVFGRQRRVNLLGPALVDQSAREGDTYVALLMQTAERFPDATVTSIVSFAEARTYMHDVLLRDTDQMSMRHGLEVRVPLLDHALAGCVMGLPEDLKTGGRPKQLLVDAIGGDVLPEIAARPKQGFVLPFDVWMRGELRDFCESHLSRSGLGGNALFNAPAVDAVWRGFLSGTGDSWSRPWALVALQAWMQTTGVRP